MPRPPSVIAAHQHERKVIAHNRLYARGCAGGFHDEPRAAPAPVVEQSSPGVIHGGYFPEIDQKISVADRRGCRPPALLQFGDLRARQLAAKLEAVLADGS